MPQDAFVGREDEQEQYRRFLSGETAWMLIITGLGGIGKSALLHRLAKLTPPDTYVVSLNFAEETALHSDPLKLLEALAWSVKSHCDLQLFDMFMNTLRKDRDQLEQYNTQMQQRIQASDAINTERALGTITISKPEDVSTFLQEVHQAMQEVHHQVRELATEAFYAQMDTFKLKRLVLMFDTGELLNEPESWEVNQWLLNEFLPRLHSHMWQAGQNCFVVMASRIPPQSEIIDEVDQQHIVLSMLEKPAVDQYLELAGMHDPALRQHVYEITHGHALCVSIIGTFYQESEQQLLSNVDTSALQKEFDERASIELINERILNNLKFPFRELTQYGVLLRSFDLPLLKAIFPELLPEQAALSQFEQFIRYPYIESLGNYRYAFHELIREVLAKKTQRDQPEEWKTYHKNALDHFTPGLGMPQASDRSVEWYYHALAYYIACDKEEEGMAHWRQAIQEAHIGRTRKDVGSLLQITYDKTLKLSPAAGAERDYEQGRFHYYSQQWEAALQSYMLAFEVFKQVKNRQGQARVAKAMGEVQRAQGKLDAALQSYTEAYDFYQIEEDRLGQAKVLQAAGGVQQSRNELDVALNSYEQAFRLFGQMEDRLGQADVRKAMGDIQRILNEREAAQQSYRQAIALYEDVGSDRGKIETERARDRLYVCYVIAAPADEEFVIRLKTDLQTQGVNVWTSRDRSQVGTLDWAEALQTMIHTSYAVLLIASPHARSSRSVKSELHFAEIYQRPVYAVWVAGTQWEEAAPLDWSEIRYIDARGAHYEMALREIATLLHKAPLTFLKPPGLDFEPRNPYKGLRAFTGDDAVDFFGREALIEDLAETIEGFLTVERHNVPASRLLTVIGPSGSGKSSVVMAGLLPGLQRGALPGSEAWVYLDPIVPGKRPLESLVLAFAPQLPEISLRTIRHDLEDDSAPGLQLLATQLVKRRGYLSPSQGSRVVLMIDQFEELFTQTLPERERQHFIDLLVAAVTEPVGPLIVVLTLRADFYDRPMHYPQLSQLIEAHHKSVLPMNLRDLRAVIEQPAALPDVQLLFEGDLVGDLIFEVQGQPGALPLLQFTLDQLFERCRGHLLTLQAYREIGGIKGALAKHAESTYASLPSEEHRRLAQALFLRLIDPGATEQDTTRRRATLAELSLPDPVQTNILQDVADAFIAARLLTTNETAGATTIEVSHEALIREWARLSDWLREEREDIHLQQVVSQDVAEWEMRGKPSDRLYRGTQLIEAQAWAERNLPSADEVAFLQASAAERRYQEDAALNQQMRELTLQRRAVSRQRLLIALLSIFSIIVIVLASVAEVSREQADQQRQIIAAQFHQATKQAQILLSVALAANAGNALAQNELDQALLLSVEANNVYNTYEARNSLLNALEQEPQLITILHGEPGQIRTLAFNRDGRSLVSLDLSGVHIWDTQKRQGHLLRFDRGATPIGSSALSPDDRTLATSNGDGVWLWDIQTGRLIKALEGKLGNTPANFVPYTSLAFSPDGTLLASSRCRHYNFDANQNVSCVETQISVLNVASGQAIVPPLPVPTRVNSIAFSPDGKLLASGNNDQTVRLWSVSAGQSSGPPRVLTGHTGPVMSVAFSPVGKTLVSGSVDGTVRLWDVASGHPVVSPLVGHTGPVMSVAFSRDGQTLVAGDRGGNVRVWDVTSGQSIVVLTGDAQPKTSVAFSPDGATLASGSQGGTIMLWNITARSTISRLLGDTGGSRSIMFSPDGTILFTGSEDGKVFLQDARSGKPIRTLDMASYPLLKPKHANDENLLAIGSLALSRDGSILAAGRLDGSILLWNWKSNTFLALFRYPDLLNKITLSSNGRVLAAGGAGSTIMLWNVAKRSVLHALAYPTNYPLPIALSPDGTLLAAGGCAQVKNGSCTQGQVLLWNVMSGNRIGQLPGHQSTVWDVAFSPGGEILASSSYDGIELWNVTARKFSGWLTIPVSSSYAGYYSNILFSPDGKMLASYSSPGTPFSFVLWDVTQREPLAHAFNEQDAFQGSVTFSPNNQQLVSVADHSIIVWDITIQSWKERACAIANRNLTMVEWQQFVRNEAYSKVCPNLPL